jgi:hypothetical protein
MTYIRGSVAVLALCAMLWPVGAARAQGVTTGAMTGIVTNPQQQPVAGADVIAVHEPSGTSYEATTRADGRFSIPGMRVGGPYSVTVAYTGAGGTAFQPETQTDVTVTLGVATDLSITVNPIAVQEQVTVTAEVDPVFSSSRTGAATAVLREEIALIPSLTGRIGDITRLTPQAASSGGFMGQDSRMNNMTVDGSSFNATFGVSSSQPGDRTGVAPISLEAIEQVQVNVAPFDVRQGSFVGAGVNTVTRSGTNEFSGSFYHRMRNQDWVGTEAAGKPVNPGTFTFRNTGGWAAGPIIRNRLFAFGTVEDEKDSRPISTFRANRGGEPVGGQVTRVLASDLQQLSAFLRDRFNYETGPFDDVNDETPARRFLLRSDLNISNAHKVSFRYNQLDSFSDSRLSSSTSALRGRTNNTTNFLTFQNSNYQTLEDIRSAIGEWNAVIGSTMANSFQTGYTYQDESRTARGSVFPLVDIFEATTSYTTFGSEPFTPQNELRYSTFQLQDNLTKFAAGHTLTFGGYAEKFHSENVFWNCCTQSAYQYNSLADFYADANGYLANPNRTVSPIVLGRFQVRWSNIPNLDKPLQPLDVWYTAGYAQDEWRPRRNLTVTGGLRFDRSQFKNTAFRNPAADALTFRDEAGNPVQYDTGRLPDPKILWSPRAGINWDVRGDQVTQVRGGTGVFSGRPAYVWISNQLGNTGVLIGERIVDNTTAFPFNPSPDAHKPTNVTGGGASSYALNVTDADFGFPQVWRTNVAMDRRLPWSITSTTEYIFARDVNGMYYINANLPAPQGTFTGADARPRWVGVTCAPTGQAGGCVNRIHNDPGNQVTVAHVLKNRTGGRSWSLSQSITKTTDFGLSLRAAYSYGVSKSLVDPESTVSTSYARMATFTNPNEPTVAHSLWSPGHRMFALASFSREYFSFGATSVSMFLEARHNPASAVPSSRISYVFAGDMNNDGVTANDLIYIPRDVSEMNFVTFTQGGRTFTAEEQAAAFDRFIEQDPYLRKHRGEYARRYAAVMPMLRTADLSVVQDVFRDIRGKRNGLQIRLDITNFGNLLNSNWGVGQATVAPVNTNNQVQVLTTPTVDAQGRAAYRLAVVSNELLSRSFEKSAFSGDVYQFMVSLRYSFN